MRVCVCEREREREREVMKGGLRDGETERKQVEKSKQEISQMIVAVNA